MDKLILNSITTLIPKLNNNWADVISQRMSKSPQTIRAYARGERGIKSGRHISLLKEMKTLYVEMNKTTEAIMHFNIESPSQKQINEYTNIKSEIIL